MTAPSLNLQRVYLKNLSLEMPHAPASFAERGALETHLEVQVGREDLADGIFEVSLRATLTASVGDRPVLLVEALQAGVFGHGELSAEHLAAAANTVCPAVLYPYLRVNIADVMSRTGLPPVHIPDVNWQALFEQSRGGQVPVEALPARSLH